MSYFAYLVDGGYIVSKFETEVEADNLVAANDDGVMSKIAAPNDSNTVNYLKYIGGNFIAETLDDIAFENFAKLRNERNFNLSECDWTQSTDSPLSDSKKTEWATYRQKLRDLPSNTSDPANPIFPDKPS